jgi:hypothetical protein
MPNFTFSTSLGGPAIKQPVDFGTVSNTGGTSEIPVYVSHDSVSDLLNVGVYLQPFSGTGYVGLYGPSQDYLDFLDWGTNTGKGLIANMDAAATTAPFDNQFKSGPSATGASATNAIPLSTAMFAAGSSTDAGHFPVGNTGHMTFKMAIPGSEGDTGLRQASVFLRFDQ